MKSILLFLTGLLCVSLYIWQSYAQRSLLHDPLSPEGILSLQKEKSTEKARAIVESWKKVNRCEENPLLPIAIRTIWLDFGFLLFYGPFLLLLLYSIKQIEGIEIKIRKWTAGALILGVLLDVTENVWTLCFMASDSISILPVYWLYKIKLYLFLVIGFSFLYLSGGFPFLTKYLGYIFFTLRKNTLSAISLAVLFLILWVTDQGQDLLITLNSHDSGPISLYYCVCVLAALHWFFAKFQWNQLTEKEEKEKSFLGLFRSSFLASGETSKEYLNYLFVARLFGMCTFLLVGFGILQAMNQYLENDSYDVFSPLLLLVLSLIVFYVVFHERWLEKIYGLFPLPFLAFSLVLAFSPLILLCVFGNTHKAGSLIWLALGFLAYALLFAMLTSVRTILANDKVENDSPFIHSILERIQSVKAGDCLLIALLLPIGSFLAFFVFNLFSYIPVGLYQCLPYACLAVVLSGIITFYVLFSYLNVVGRRYQVYATLFLLVFCIGMGAYVHNPFHQVRAVSHTKALHVNSLAEHAKEWLSVRANEKSDTGKYSIFIVNTYGGGISAAAWTCLAVSHLDSLTQNQFQKHVFAYSGASGGTIGASILCANGFLSLKDSLKPRHYKRFFANDFLTSVMVGLIANDVVYSTIPLFSDLDDRGGIQELNWEKTYEKQFGASFYSQMMDSLWANDHNKQVPLLFSNTTDVRTGKKGVAAPVRLQQKDFFHSVLLRNLLPDTASLRLSTAAFLSARFPFISPSARFDEHHYFLDGGIKENSGAETAQEVYRVLKKQIEDMGLGQKFEVCILSLRYGAIPDKTCATDSLKTPKDNVKKLFEWFAPLSAAINVGGTAEAATKSDSLNVLKFASKFKNEPGRDPLAGDYFSLQPTRFVSQKNEVAVFPLGWKISYNALQCMDNSMRVYNTDPEALKKFRLKEIVEKVK